MDRIKRIRVGVFPLVFVTFIFILLLAIIGVPISNYSSVFLLGYTLALYFIFPIKRSLIISFLVLVLFLFIFLFLYKKSIWYYVIIDLLTVAFVHIMVSIVKLRIVKQNDIRVIRNVSFFYVLLVVVGVFFPMFYARYEVDRYMGLNLGPNLTSSIFILFLIIFFEYSKLIKNNVKKELLLITLLYVVIAVATKSRGFMLSGTLYLVYNYINVFRKKYVYFVLVVIISVVIINFLPDIQSKLRISDDQSFETRLALYITILKELHASYYVMPNGFEADALLLDSTHSFKGVELHNDILKYLYNYGFLFVFYLFYLGRQFYCFFENKKEYAIVVFILLLNALQNTLFSIFILVPLLGVFMIKKYKIQSEVVTGQ